MVVTFTATDDSDPAASTSETITIAVAEVNDAPAVDVVGDPVVDGRLEFATNYARCEAEVHNVPVFVRRDAVVCDHQIAMIFSLLGRWLSARLCQPVDEVVKRQI